VTRRNFAVLFVFFSVGSARDLPLRAGSNLVQINVTRDRNRPVPNFSKDDFLRHNSEGPAPAPQRTAATSGSMIVVPNAVCSLFDRHQRHRDTRKARALTADDSVGSAL
jgi:hypothetical protein